MTRHWRNNTRSLAARFTSTSGRTAPAGNVQAISRARIVAPARRKRAPPKARKSPRTGIYSFGENFSLDSSKPKRPFARCLNTFYANAIMTRGERSKQNVKGQYLRSSVHLVPFFGNMDISKITTGNIVEYRIHRHQQAIAKRASRRHTARRTMK